MTAPRAKWLRAAAWLPVLGAFFVLAPAASARHSSGRAPGGHAAPGQPTAPAASSVNAEVMLLHATNSDGGGGIDPSIGPLPALRRPPFSSYNTYKLVSRTKLPVNKATSATTTLPNGRVLQITLRDVLPANRFRIAASINQPGGTTFLPLLEVTVPAGEPFFVAGQSYQAGMLVIGITVLK